MKFYSLILILIFLSEAHVLPYSETFQSDMKWELKKEKNNIKVFVRDSSNTGIKQIRSIATVKASVEELVAIVYDIDSYPLWIANLETANILEKVSEEEIYYYYQAAVPWPFKNRDDVMRFVMKKNTDNEGVTILFTGHPDYIPEKDKIVRMRLNKGHWKFTPVSNGETEIDYVFFTDEGKGYPNWLVNIFIVDGPFEIISNLKEQVKKNP